MLDKETEKEVFFGCVCASKLLGVAAKSVRDTASAADRAKQQEALKTAYKAHAERDAKWQAFLDANAVLQGVGNRFKQIASLGGYAAAHTMFEAQS
jgi:hypothetical protein